MSASKPLRLIAGLGNPGSGHDGDRHNAGFWLLDRLAEERRLAWQSDGRMRADIARDGDGVRYLKPQTFMNLSGEAVAACARYFRIAPEEVLVVHDELDLPPGQLRVKAGGGHGGHNGLRSIDQHLGAKDYLRLRIGIGHPGSAAEVSRYVLSSPSPADREAIHAAIESALGLFDDLLAGRIDRAMNQLNRRKAPPAEKH